MAASTRKTGKRGILHLARVFREAPVDAPLSTDAVVPPSAPEVQDARLDGPETPLESSAAAPDPVVDATAAADGAEDTIAGLRRLSAAADLTLGETAPEERTQAVQRIEEEIHRRLARWLRLEDELRDRTREIQRLEAANDASRIWVTALEAQVGTLTSERDAARQRACELEAELQAERQNPKADLERCRALERDLALALADGAERGRLLQEAEARVRDLTGQLATHRDALAGLQGTMTDLQGVMDEGERQKATLASRLEDLERALGEARTQRAADKQTQDELWAALAELRRESRTAEEFLARAATQERDLGTVKAQLSRLEQHNAELIEELEAARSGLEARSRERTAALAEQVAGAEARSESAAAGLAAAQAELVAIVGQRDALVEEAASLDARLGQRAREVEALEQAGAQLLMERDSQRRTIQELHAQLRTHKKLVRVLGNGMGGVDEVAATVRSLDDWVSHQLEGRPAEVPAQAGAGQRPSRALEALSGPRSARYPVDKSVFTIGRAADSDMRVGGPYTSRHHARILNDGPDAVIEDLGSANGLLVNDARVVRCVLRDGDVVDIGGSRFRFVDGSTAGAPRPPATDR